MDITRCTIFSYNLLVKASPVVALVDKQIGFIIWYGSSQKWPGPWFNIKMSYQYRKSHCGDKMVVRSSYLHNGISHTGKMSSLYWIGAQKSFFVIVDITSCTLLSCNLLINVVALHWMLHSGVIGTTKFNWKNLNGFELIRPDERLLLEINKWEWLSLNAFLRQLVYYNLMIFCFPVKY